MLFNVWKSQRWRPQSSKIFNLLSQWCQDATIQAGFRNYYPLSLKKILKPVNWLVKSVINIIDQLWQLYWHFHPHGTPSAIIVTLSSPFAFWKIWLRSTLRQYFLKLFSHNSPLAQPNGMYEDQLYFHLFITRHDVIHTWVMCVHFVNKFIKCHQINSDEWAVWSCSGMHFTEKPHKWVNETFHR